jgi:hypothetical protein
MFSHTPTYVPFQGQDVAWRESSLDAGKERVSGGSLFS